MVPGYSLQTSATATSAANAGAGGDIIQTPNFYQPIASGSGSRNSPTFIFSSGREAPQLRDNASVREAPKTFGDAAVGGKPSLWIWVAIAAAVGLAAFLFGRRG